MGNVIIREANINDLESILLLSDALTLADLPFDKKVKVDWAHSKEGKKYYEGIITKKDGICFVAVVDEKIVGYETAGKMETASFRKVTIGEITNIYVLEGFRSQGIGKMLMNKFVEWAKEMGFDKVSVNVFALNEKAINFYKREGFLPQDLILEKTIK